MSTRTIASLYSGVFEGKRLVVEQGDDPAHRTHKSLGLARPPIHVLGPVKRIQFFRQSFNQNVPSASPFPLLPSGFFPRVLRNLRAFQRRQESRRPSVVHAVQLSPLATNCVPAYEHRIPLGSPRHAREKKSWKILIAYGKRVLVQSEGL